MFNKPTLFPKAGSDASAASVTTTSSVSAPRAGRLVPGSGVSPTGSVSSENQASGRDAGSAATAGKQANPAGEVETAQGSSDSRLIVGTNVKLKGAEILDCDTLVVEGRVEAKMDSRVIRVAENGFFSGTVVIDVAEIHGRFEGELTAKSQLIIHSTGRVSGKIRYGKIYIEEGGEISGDIKAVDADSSNADVTEQPQFGMTSGGSESESPSSMQAS